MLSVYLQFTAQMPGFVIDHFSLRESLQTRFFCILDNMLRPELLYGQLVLKVAI